MREGPNIAGIGVTSQSSGATGGSAINGGHQPMTDTYTKIILSVIAACLVAIAVRQAPPSANAQFGLGCDGSPQAPCYVRLIQ